MRDKIRIGIGICTYNRLSLLRKLLVDVEKTSSGDLFVSNDGSTDGTKDFLLKERIDSASDKTEGIGHSKNRILRRFADFDFIFILEDDVILLKRGWEELFINACNISGIHHFTYSPEFAFGNSQNITKFDGITLAHPPYDGGVFSFYTKKVIEECGGFNPSFKGFGFEHCEYTDRIHKVGLSGRHRVNHILESETFVSYIPDNSVIDPKLRNEYRNINFEIRKKSHCDGVIKCPL